MYNNIEQVLSLEQVLEIVDIRNTNQCLIKVQNAPLDIDYIQLEELRQKIGNIGENYVYESEKKRLAMKNSKYAEFVDNSPAKDPKNGYDILSYTEDGEPIYIEVKSTIGGVHTPFYMTENEKKTAETIRNNGGIYQLHRVFNIGKKISVAVYENDDLFIFEEVLFAVTIKKNWKK